MYLPNSSSFVNNYLELTTVNKLIDVLQDFKNMSFSSCPGQIIWSRNRARGRAAQWGCWKIPFPTTEWSLVPIISTPLLRANQGSMLSPSAHEGALREGRVPLGFGPPRLYPSSPEGHLPPCLYLPLSLYSLGFSSPCWSARLLTTLGVSQDPTPSSIRVQITDSGEEDPGGRILRCPSSPQWAPRWIKDLNLPPNTEKAF